MATPLNLLAISSRRAVANSGVPADRLANNTVAGMDLAVISRGKDEKKAAFSCLHKACELRGWQRSVDVPERTLVLDLARGEDEPAHGGAIE